MQEPSETPDVSFDDLDLPDWLTERIAEIGYDQPTPVQVAAIPRVRAGVDVVAQAQTGTGKTAAFAIPILAKLQPSDGPAQAVILAPTRELARQVSEEFTSLGEGCELESFSIYGGVGMEPQIDAFGRAHVLICTPGRLLDHLRRGNLSFENLRIFGLDEADEMLSMGFEREIREILSLLPKERQNILFSATMPRAVMHFADSFLVDPEKLNLSSDSVGAQNVRHIEYRITGDARIAALRSLLRSRTVRGAIIFSNTRHETFRVHELLQSEGYAAGVLNGDLAQKEREKILLRLKEESLDFLVATDIAARGIDVSWLRAVVNYEMPGTAESYIHRTGRTGRAGQMGTAYSLITPADVSVVHALHKRYDMRFEKGTLPDRLRVRALRSDELIDGLLESLDTDQQLVYGQYLAVANRLAERKNGKRDIAKLLAFFEQTQHARPARAQQPADNAPPRASKRTDTAHDEQPQSGSPSPGTRPADGIVAWLNDHSRSNPPTRSAHAIATALQLDEEEVNAIAGEDDRLERLTGRNIRWRVIESAGTPPQTSPQHDTDRATGERTRIQRIKDPQVQPKSQNASPIDVPKSWVRLHVNVGSDNFSDDRDLANWFAEYAGFDSSDIRAVKCQKKSATVEVDGDYWRDFVEALHNQPWNDQQLRVHRAR